MSTFGDMKTRIASEILRTSWADSFVATAIQDAIDDYKFTHFRFNVGRFRLDTVADQEFYTIPAALKADDGSALATGVTLLEIDAMSCRFNNAASPVTPVTDGWLEAATTTNTTGQPCHYSWVDDRIRYTPIPDQVYQIFITGLKALPTLSAGGDTNAWMTQGAALIRARAKVRLYRDIMRNEGAAVAAQGEESAALGMLQRGVGAQQSNRLQAWGY